MVNRIWITKDLLTSENNRKQKYIGVGVFAGAYMYVCVCMYVSTLHLCLRFLFVHRYHIDNFMDIIVCYLI